MEAATSSAQTDGHLMTMDASRQLIERNWPERTEAEKEEAAALVRNLVETLKGLQYPRRSPVDLLLHSGAAALMGPPEPRVTTEHYGTESADEDDE